MSSVKNAPPVTNRGPGVTVAMARDSNPYYRSVNFYHEQDEDDSGKTEIRALPKDDVLESLKRKDQGQGTTLLLQPAGNGLSFQDVINKTIGEYQAILDAQKYKDKDDRIRMELTIKELKR